MPTWQPDLAPLVKRIPRLYALLKAVGDASQADVGLTNAMREVMTALAAAGPRTVPELARERLVSRQHVQAVVNDLAAAGLAETQPNPSHRRSPLIALTDEGRRRLKRVDDRAAALLARIAPSVAPAELAAAVRLFDLLERELAPLSPR